MVKAHILIVEDDKAIKNAINTYKIEKLDTRKMELIEKQQMPGLSKEEEMFEFLMMGLRLCDGISLSVFENRFACSFFDVYQEAYAKLSAQGLLVNEGDRIKTTPQGLHLLHEVLLALM